MLDTARYWGEEAKPCGGLYELARVFSNLFFIHQIHHETNLTKPNLTGIILGCSTLPVTGGISQTLWLSLRDKQNK